MVGHDRSVGNGGMFLQRGCGSLQLTAEQRARTIVGLDARGGTLAEVNACLEAGYQYHGKDFSTARAKKLATSVEIWYDDPKQPRCQVG